MGRVRKEKGRSERRNTRISRKKSKMREKVKKVAKHSVFPMFCGSEGSKVGSLQRLMWSQLGKRPRKIARCCGAKPIWKSKCSKHLILGALLEVEMSKKCTRLWHVAHDQVKIIKTPQCGITFGSRAFEKVHAVVAHSTFSSQKC